MNPRKSLARILRWTILPLLPRARRLPFIYRLYQIEGRIEPELSILESLIERNDVGIDIGANSGLYSYRMAGLFTKVYAFEVNDELTQDLIAFNPGNIEVIHVGLSSQCGDATLYVPVLNGARLTGWASLAPGNCLLTSEHSTKPVQIRTLDSFSLNQVSFMKIDVEGHEMQVLQGALETIARCRPTVLVEIRERNRAAAEQFFSELGYVQRQADAAAEGRSSSENFIFVPG